EMMNGHEDGTITDGWRSAEVRDALDLCLACKGCKTDCPADVDMATYKAEFLAHHYAGRLRPRADYALGWLAVPGAAVSRPAAGRDPGGRRAGAPGDPGVRTPHVAAVVGRARLTWQRRAG